jgi:hypothetical protein
MSGTGRIRTGVSEFLFREKGRLLLLSVFLLVGCIAFEAGFLQGSAVAAKPLIVERPDISGCPGGEVAGASSESAVSGAAESKATPTGPAVPDATKCAFVGSRNSTLYHLPSCAPEKRIKPENLVCFTSEADAQAKGYKAGCVK